MSDSLNATVIVIRLVSTISANAVLEPDEPLEPLEPLEPVEPVEPAPPRLPAAEVPVPVLDPEDEPELEPEPPAEMESPGDTL
jgi:hypothetical protein